MLISYKNLWKKFWLKLLNDSLIARKFDRNSYRSRFRGSKPKNGEKYKFKISRLKTKKRRKITDFVTVSEGERYKIILCGRDRKSCVTFWMGGLVGTRLMGPLGCCSLPKCSHVLMSPASDGHRPPASPNLILGINQTK